MAEQLPSPDELGATLDDALSANVQSFADTESGLTDLDFLTDDLGFADAEADQQQLQYLISLAERYPGLRITLSFG